MMTHCPITGVNIARFLIITIAGFAFNFAFNAIFHGMLLEEQYEATAHLWRTPEEMKALFPLCLIPGIAYVMALAFVFTRHFEDKGIGEGIRFGAALGVVLGVMQFTTYLYMPISIGLAAVWFIGTFVQTTIIGIIFALLYKK